MSDNTFMIDLADWQNMEMIPVSNLDDSEVTIDQNGNGDLTMNSLTATSSYLFYRIPSKLPIGCRVEISCEISIISGAVPLLSLDSYDSPDYGGPGGAGSNKILEGDVDAIDSPMFQRVSHVMTVKPGNQYVRAVIGYFNSRIGQAQFRAPRITITGADMSKVMPWLRPVTAKQVWTAVEFNKWWAGTTQGAGTINRNPTNVILTAPSAAADRAFIRASDSNLASDVLANAFYGLEGSHGIMVRVKGSRFDGFPAIYMDYYDSGGSLIEVMRAHFTGEDGGQVRQDFWFPAVENAVAVAPAIGFFTANAGQFALDEISIEVIDSPSLPASILGTQPIFCTLLKSGGVWEIDDDSVDAGSARLRSSNIAQISVNPARIQVDFNTGGPRGRGVAQAMIDSTSGAFNDYYVGTELTSAASTLITFWDRSTDLKVDPNTIPDGTFVTLLGLATH